MAVALLYAQPTTIQDIARWSFVHYASHHDICRLIFQTMGLELTEYVIDPIDVSPDRTLWAFQHQTMHDQMNNALGLQGQDLTSVDWTDDDIMDDWIYNNAQEHQAAVAVLGID